MFINHQQPFMQRLTSRLLLPILLLGVATQAVADHTLPEILDFYPNCEYQVLDTVTVSAPVSAQSMRTHDSEALIKPTQRILHKLREKALKQQADGIILVKLYAKTTAGGLSTGTRGALLSYRAELIKQCQRDRRADSKLTPYNHQGKQNIGVSLVHTKMPPMTIKLPEKARLNHPTLTDHLVSLSHGVYGVSLGMSYQQVAAIWGSPSAELALLENELVIAYGRRHWLHFQADKLVKIGDTALLDIEVLNRIPLRAFFDNKDWKINGQLGYQSSLVDVRSALAVTTPLSNDNRLMISANDQIMNLQFKLKRDMHRKETYHLVGFTLQSKTYHKAILRQTQQQGLYTAVSQIYQQLQDNQAITVTALQTLLDEPIGRILVSANEAIAIYDNHLLLTTKGKQLSKIHLLEKIFVTHQLTAADQTNIAPWQLGEIKQGQSIEQVKKQLPLTAFAIDEQIELSVDNYQLTLFFDETETSSRCYQAEIHIY